MRSKSSAKSRRNSRFSAKSRRAFAPSKNSVLTVPRLCDEQIAQCELELEMLKQPDCEHPEYLAMIKAVDDRRAEKVAYERQLLQYKQKNLEIITTAERHQLHSQYFQTVRDKREDILSLCNQKIFELQRGRRQLGVDEVEYMMKLPEKRSDQIRHQTAYNLEVSILSGVAKYVGFPAAPEIRPARTSEIEDDLRAMKVSDLVLVPQLSADASPDSDSSCGGACSRLSSHLCAP